jgi:hypothetical protein
MYLRIIHFDLLQANRTELTDSQRQMLMQQGPAAVVDRALAQQDAQKLYQAGVKKIGTDESAFLAVLSIRHEFQMRATFEEYQKVKTDLFSRYNYIKCQLKSEETHAY